MSKSGEGYKFFSSHHEKAVADFLKWGVVAGSGSRPCAVGDVRSDLWLGECKTHTTVSNIVFDKHVWDKICREAQSVLHYPVLFADDGTQQVTHTWCMISPEQLPAETILPECPVRSERRIMSFSHDALFKMTGSGTQMLYVSLDGKPLVIMSLVLFHALFS